jgi:hypothetical protein
MASPAPVGYLVSIPTGAVDALPAGKLDAGRHGVPQCGAQACAWVTWVPMNTSSFAIHTAQWGAVLLAGAGLAGCYVVPMQPMPPTSPIAGPTAMAPMAPPPPVLFTARLYPANDLASGYGLVAATVSNDLNGHGRFSTALDGESFVGEATRVAGSAREGLANGAGSRGGYLSCRYTMNTATLGSGTCRLNNGALFTMHVGS